MKTKWYLGTFATVAGFVVILLIFMSLGNSGMTSLPQQYPEIPEGRDFRGEILWDGAETGIPLLLTDDQFISSLCLLQIKEKGSFQKLPSPAITVHFTGKTENYFLVLGADGRISVETEENPEESRRFFLDRTGNIYRSLYEEHLQSGGMEVPRK